VADLTFVGAAGTVTGSKHLLTIDGKHIFIDCGMFQGTVDVRTLNDAPLPVAASEIAAVVITHGHLDHVGYLPKLVKDGLKGPIFCTPPTKAIMQLVLDDSANLQNHLQHRGFQHQRPYSPPPYYDEGDVIDTMKLVTSFDLHQDFDVAGVTKATFYNAGHILGSAFVALAVDGKRVIFSGDLGRYDRPLLFDPEPIGAADDIICESTYGDRVHPPQPITDLQNALLAGIDRGGAMVIPAFSIERSQDLLLAIGTLQKTDPKIAKIAVHLDSPMAEKVDAAFEAFPTWHKPIQGDSVRTPFGVLNLTIHETTDESKQLNDATGPRIIISASGMAAGGRVLHHLHNNISDPKATVIFVGYQGAGTLGFYLTHGAHTINLLGDALPVRATIVDLAGFSAHADENELKRWLSTCTTKPHLYAVHGEAASAAALAAMAKGALGWSADVAERGTTVTL
jgi:metallo-beta-lactamase family protein